MMTLLTCRPEFRPPWGFRAHLTPITLNRLPRTQVEVMVERVVGGKALPAEVHQPGGGQDRWRPAVRRGVGPKMVLESGLLQEQEDRYALTGPLPPLAIPCPTLHDSLMARLDRLATVKSLAQLGATLGREGLPMPCCTPCRRGTKRPCGVGWHQLVQAEFIQQGLPPQATYLFKHALIQEAAYQSLLKSTRQQYHQRVAQVLEGAVSDTAETQPELLAHHYADAGLLAQALPYWQQAGQQALQALRRIWKRCGISPGGSEVLAALPETRGAHPARAHLADDPGLGLDGAQGPGSPGSRTGLRPCPGAVPAGRGDAAALPDPVRAVAVLSGARASIRRRGNWRSSASAWHSGSKTQRSSLEAHFALGVSLLWLGEVVPARAHLEQSIALYNPQEHRALAFPRGH